MGSHYVYKIINKIVKFYKIMAQIRCIMQGFWPVTIKYVIIRGIYTVNKVVHSRTWSNIIVTDRHKCKNGLYVECGVQILSQNGV